MMQETFPDEAAARQFGGLVDRVGGKTAREVLAARSHSGDAPTLRAYTATYLDPESGLLTGIEPGTRKGYERAANNSFLQILGEYPIDSIDKDDVGKWLAWQEQQRSHRDPSKLIAAKTIRNYHSILSAVMSSAVERNLRDDNPAYRTRLTRGTQREPVFLTPAEFATLLHFISDRYKPLVMFLAGTGTRWGEATAVAWGALNLTATPPTVRIDRAWKKGPTGAPLLKQPKSARGRRTVSLPADVVTMLGEPGKADELVFRGPLSGGHIWYHRFRTTTWLPAVAAAMDKEKCAAAGMIRLTRAPNIHDLRHTHASWLIARGAPLPYIQARLGHESINTTVGVYGHLVPDAHQQLADITGDALAAVHELHQLTE
jgi:integrase